MKSLRSEITAEILLAVMLNIILQRLIGFSGFDALVLFSLQIITFQLIELRKQRGSV